jgi:hypothetical protein
MSNFDAQTALLFEKPEYPAFHVQHSVPLRQASAEKRLKPDSPLLCAQFGEHVISFPMLAMIYHHVAQGMIGDLAWVASFCALCNAGSIFNANLEGQVYHFAAQGYADAMTLLADQESQSYWNHLTGNCLHGKLSGKKLEQLASFLQMTADDILNAYPNALFASDNMSADDVKETEEWDKAERLSEKPSWDEDEELVRSLRHEDTRLPRHEMGLGIWTETSRRFYPIRLLYKQQNLFFDEFEGRRILVYSDPHVGLPMALYSEANHAEWHGDEIHLSGNQELKKATLYQDGKAVNIERPRQNAIRWHGFSAVFPDCEVYGL